MESQTIFAALRDAFAELYPEESSARVVAEDAGLEPSLIAFSPRAQTNWHNILAEAIRQNGLDQLLAIARSNYGNFPAFRAAMAAYQQHIEAQGPLQLHQLQPSDADAPAPGDSPYQGMEFFDVGDAARFFGREALTAELVAALIPPPPTNGSQTSHLLAVVGASGSGKSSLVRAGLVPALQGKKPLAEGIALPPSSTRWLVRIITPTAHPLKALAGSLTRDSESVRTQAILMDDLQHEARSLDLYVHRLVQGGNRLLLVVDQFEELFTLCKDRDERQAFVDNLLTATGNDSVVTLVLTLRADFYHFCADFPALRAVLETQQKYIGAMSQAELRRAIEEPAKLGGWQLQPGLAEQMLQDVGNEPGALPLLSHALLETWKRRSGRTLTLAGYQAAGGVQGAIAKTADDTFNSFTSKQQMIARAIFLRLTELGEDAQDTRRHVRPDELNLNNANPEEVNDVLRTLADTRLITTDSDKVQVAHEALIRAWHKLREWLADDREGLLILHRLGEAAAIWEENDKAAGYLYRSLPLQQASAWAAENEERLNPREQNFLMASQQAEDAARAEHEEMLRREAEQRAQLAAEQARTQEQAKLNDRLRLLRNGLAVLVSIIAIVAWMAMRSSQEANRQAQEADRQTQEANHQKIIAESAKAEADNLNQLIGADLIVANSVRLVDIDPQRALLIAAEASQTIFEQGSDHPSSLISAETDFRRLLQQVGGIPLRTYADLFFPRLFSRNVTMALGAKGHWLAVVSDEKVWLWSLTDPNTPHILPLQPKPSRALAFSPDEAWLATAGLDKKIYLWRMDHLNAKPQVLEGHTALAKSLTFSPDGQWLASAGADATVKLWSMTQVVSDTLTLGGQENNVSALVFSPDGRQLAGSDTQGQIRLWSMSTPTANPQLLAGHRDQIVAFSFSHYGHWLASASADTTIRLWNLDEPNVESLVLDQHPAPVWAVAFSPDDRWLASGSRDRTVRLWVMSDPTAIPRILAPSHTDNVSAIAFSPDGHWLASGSWDQTVHLWDMNNPAAEGRVLRGHEFQIVALSFTADSRWLVSAGKDQIVRLWDMANPLIEPHILTDHAAEITSVAFSPDQQWLASAGTDGAIHLRKTAHLEESLVLTGHQGAVNAITFSSIGNWLASAGTDQTVRLWDLTDPLNRRPVILEHKSAIHTVAFSPDGQLLASGSGGANGDNAVRVWQMGDPATPSQVFTDNLGIISAVAFSPNGRWLAAGDELRMSGNQREGRLWLWEVANPSHFYMVKADDFAVRSVAFSPDSQLLASSGLDWLVKVWEVPGLTNPQILRGHISTIFSTAFSPNGQLLASTGFERKIHVWDRQQWGEQPRILYGHSDTVRSVAFSPNGQWLISGGDDKSVRLWTASITGLIAKACQTAGRNLTHEEWSLFFPGRAYHQTCPQWPEER
ncbi:MAG: effector-associated domain EAD1-containing protein [Caldilineaceae bacterium]